jgi:hypothetical protein
MSLYVSDGEMYAGWSTGRWFGLAGVVALATAALGFAANHGYIGHALLPSDQVFAFAAQWIGGGLALLMAIAVLGSIQIQERERGDVEVSDLGVRRIFKPGREVFLPREEIAALIARPGGGVDLVDRSNRRRMVVPRSIYGYRDCISEIKAMGVESRPCLPGWNAFGRRKRTWWENALLFAQTYAFCLLFNRHSSAIERHVAGLAGFSLFLVMAYREVRERPEQRWLNYGFAALAFLAVVWRW